LEWALFVWRGGRCVKHCQPAQAAAVGRRPYEETATLGLYKISDVRLSDHSHS
jgi:hypothetical protein